MGHLFYVYVLLTTIVLFSILSKFFNIKSIQEWYEKFEKVTGKKPEKSDFRTEDEYNLYNSVSIVIVLELLILVGGLLSASWYVYLLLFIISILIKAIIKPIQFSIVGKSVSFMTHVTRVFCYVFLIINHFHLHIDVYQLLK